MEFRSGFRKALAVAFLVLTLSLVVGSVFVDVNAQEGPPYLPPYPFPPTFPVNNFDFSIIPSATLVKIQPGQTGGLVVWVSPYCPNSTTTIRCDSSVLQVVTLSILGCPSGAFCTLDRQQVLVPPLYPAGSNFIIYTFATITSSSGVTQVTVAGADQFGHTHSTTFGVIVCYC